MTERQMRWEAEKERYNSALKTKVVKYLGCSITYENPAGYAYFAVKAPWCGRIELEEFKTITKAKEAIKRAKSRQSV